MYSQQASPRSTATGSADRADASRTLPTSGDRHWGNERARLTAVHSVATRGGRRGTKPPNMDINGGRHTEKLQGIQLASKTDTGHRRVEHPGDRRWGNERARTTAARSVATRGWARTRFRRQRSHIAASRQTENTYTHTTHRRQPLVLWLFARSPLSCCSHPVPAGGRVVDAHAKLCHVPRGSQILEWVVVLAL